MTDTLEGFPQCASVLRVEDLPSGLPKEPVRCLKMDGHTDSHGAKNLGWPATYESDALAAHDRKIAAEALRTEAFSGLYGTFAQKRLLTRADRIEQGGES